jgi:hypothetical protein
LNYQKIYDLLIERARDRIIPDKTEKHHVLPKCLGGTNENYNIVKLTAKEHYVAHHLLYRIHPTNRKLMFAYTSMCFGSRNHSRYFSARMYENAKNIRSKLFTGESNPNFGNKTGGSKGYKHKPETIEKMRLIKLGKKRSPFTRKPATEETKRKISESQKLRLAKIKNSR